MTLITSQLTDAQDLEDLIFLFLKSKMMEVLKKLKILALRLMDHKMILLSIFKIMGKVFLPLTEKAEKEMMTSIK